MTDFYDELTAQLASRRTADPATSYVAKLHQKGADAILKKIGEEATEVILAAKSRETGGDSAHLVYELADLWFHCLVLMSHYDLSPSLVLAELQRRQGQSGLAEKAARSPINPE